MASAPEHLSSRTRYEWLAQLNTEYRPQKEYRRTSIIGTIGRRAWRHLVLHRPKIRPEPDVRRAP